MNKLQLARLGRLLEIVQRGLMLRLHRLHIRRVARRRRLMRGEHYVELRHEPRALSSRRLRRAAYLPLDLVVLRNLAPEDRLKVTLLRPPLLLQLGCEICEARLHRGYRCVVLGGEGARAPLCRRKGLRLLVCLGRHRRRHQRLQSLQLCLRIRLEVRIIGACLAQSHARQLELLARDALHVRVA